MVKIANIPFENIGSIPRQIKDFLNGKICDFREDLFSDENFEKKIHEKKQQFTSEKRKLISKVIQQQMEGLPLSEKQIQNLEKLQRENAFTVTTGHQLNLFSGPVFFIYKILQTVKTANYLSIQFPEFHFVPIFWMASEDHDFEEINHFRTQNNHYQINENSGGAVGKIQLNDVSFISEFEKEFQNLRFGPELITMLKESYSAGSTLSAATRSLVNKIFSEYGLLILDGDSKELKESVKPLFEDELRNQTLYYETQQKVAFLSEKYKRIQVNPREINLFYLDEKRSRIVKNDDSYSVDEGRLSFSEQEILNHLETFPEKFSPNALMRPVYQEWVLPNIAYIGGNAEIMYWMEIKDYFKKIGLLFPILIPRNSMLFLSHKTVSKVEKNGLSLLDFFSDYEAIINERLIKNHPISDVLNQQEAQMEKIFDRLNIIAGETDITFGNLVQAEQVRQLKSFKRMKKRLLRAEKIKNKELIDRQLKLYNDIHPQNVWQERYANFSVFYAELGYDWLETCFREMQVQGAELIVMKI